MCDKRNRLRTFRFNVGLYKIFRSCQHFCYHLHYIGLGTEVAQEHFQKGIVNESVHTRTNSLSSYCVVLPEIVDIPPMMLVEYPGHHLVQILRVDWSILYRRRNSRIQFALMSWVKLQLSVVITQAHMVYYTLSSLLLEKMCPNCHCDYTRRVLLVVVETI